MKFVFNIIVWLSFATWAAILGCGGFLSIKESLQKHGYTKAPPSYVLIKGERWYINPEKGLEEKGKYGYTYCSQKFIAYDSELSTTVLRETLWHEIFHAELCDKKIPLNNLALYVDPSLSSKYPNWQRAVDGEEHDVVYPLAMAQASFIHDNPGFVEWATEWR